MTAVLTNFNRNRNRIFGLNRNVRRSIPPRRTNIFIRTIRQLSRRCRHWKIVVSLTSLHTRRVRLTSSIVHRSQLSGSPPSLVTKTSIKFRRNKRIAQTTVILLGCPSLRLIRCGITHVTAAVPCVPNFLSFHRCPTLLTT